MLDLSWSTGVVVDVAVVVISLVVCLLKWRIARQQSLGLRPVNYGHQFISATGHLFTSRLAVVQASVSNYDPYLKLVMPPAASSAIRHRWLTLYIIWWLPRASKLSLVTTRLQIDSNSGLDISVVPLALSRLIWSGLMGSTRGWWWQQRPLTDCH